MSYAITKVQNANARRGGDVLLEVLESEGWNMCLVIRVPPNCRLWMRC